MTRAGIAAAGLLLLALAPNARAHSLLLESAPAADAQLAAPPTEISLRFNNRIEKKLSTIRLVDERGGARPVTMLATGPADRLTASVPSTCDWWCQGPRQPFVSTTTSRIENAPVAAS